MPANTRGKERDQNVAVKLSAKLKIYYQFKTKDLSQISGVSEADLAVLEHLKITPDGETYGKGSIVFLRANSPKPARVSLKLSRTASQGTVGTFCATPALTNTLRAGWNLVKPASSVTVRTVGKRITAIAKISNGVLYAFPLDKADFEKYKEPLGLVGGETITTDAEKAKLVTGSSLPKPGKAKLTLDDGSDFSTFCSHDAPLTGGFSRISAERLI